VLASVIALMLVIAWLARLDINQRHSHYDIYFQGSVSGLGVGGDVRYRGIRIGRVSTLRIAAQDPGKVRVTVEVRDGPQIREGDRAELQLQGLTGVAFVNIQGADADSPPLRAAEGEPRPVIPSRPSQIEKLFASAPELLSRSILLAEQLGELFGAENRTLITASLHNLHAFSTTLAEQRGRIVALLEELQHDGRELRLLTAELRGTAARADDFFAAGTQTLHGAGETLRRTDATLAGIGRLLDGDLAATLDETRRAAGGFAGAAEELRGLLAETREPMRDFAAEGLVEFARFASEARSLTRSLDRLVERLEREGLRPLVAGGEGGDFAAEDERE